MEKPRIFLGSSAKQAKLLEEMTRGLEDVARVEPWMTSFNPGTTTLGRLLELTREVDFAAFVFAEDDWTANSPPALLCLDPLHLQLRCRMQRRSTAGFWGILEPCHPGWTRSSCICARVETEQDFVPFPGSSLFPARPFSRLVGTDRHARRRAGTSSHVLVQLRGS